MGLTGNGNQLSLTYITISDLIQIPCDYHFKKKRLTRMFLKIHFSQLVKNLPAMQETLL